MEGARADAMEEREEEEVKVRVPVQVAGQT